MRTAIKMILLKAAKGLGKTGEEIEVSTPEQAEYFEEKGIASRDPEAGSLPPSDETGNIPVIPEPVIPEPVKPIPKKTTTKKHEKDH